MNQERLYNIVLGPVVSERAAMLADSANQVVFKVVADAEKAEIKAAVEKLFNVSVEQVRTLNVKGKTKRTRHGIGRRSGWKKAYVRLAEGSDINFEAAE
ncbi:50S ribosomal protein L23 [Microbulbifer sp. 2201CG32-9]|uniref:50S ribosomal protein L23 n=1 Tax=unclassified Microbulbifer TaxID=2619833 RepID=UPI00345C533D